MITAVIERHYHIDHWIAGDHTFFHRLFNPFFNGRNKFLRNNPALNFIYKFKACARISRLNFKPNMAVLAAAAGLTDKLTFSLLYLFNRLSVSNLRLAHISEDSKFPFHTVDNNL